MRSDPLRPVLLRDGNFTPPQRTPWGGWRITKQYKQGLPLQQVGESWEISCAADFPSRLAADDVELDTLIRRAPLAWLGEAGKQQHSTALLVKWIDAAEVLSLQVHPDDTQALADGGRSGKSECWLILDHAPGAGLYLGFRAGVERHDVEGALSTGADLRPLLFFTSVQAGDFFLVPEGTPHAIGAGIALLEAQRVRPGQDGITYRFWDWNRRYAATGQPDAQGQSRQLHAAQALAATRWQAPREEELLAQLRVRAGLPRTDGPAQMSSLTGMAAYRPFPVAMWRLQGSGALPLEAWPIGHLLGITVVAGVLVLRDAAGELRVTSGRSAVVPAAARLAGIDLVACHAVLSMVIDEVME